MFATTDVYGAGIRQHVRCGVYQTGASWTATAMEVDASATGPTAAEARTALVDEVARVCREALDGYRWPEPLPDLFRDADPEALVQLDDSDERTRSFNRGARWADLIVFAGALGQPIGAAPTVRAPDARMRLTGHRLDLAFSFWTLAGSPPIDG